MKLSVIMLTYNRENFVANAIKSIQRQTLDDFEFIIVDNCSTDNSGKIAERFAKQDKRIKVIHVQENNAIGSGRNIGLNIATGDFIAFVDDDDIAEPDMMEFLYNLAINNNADISICGSTKLVGGKVYQNCVFDNHLLMTPSEAIVELLKRKKFNAAMPTKMLKRELFNNIRFNSTSKYDDITVVYKYIANAKKIVAQGLPKYCFCRHNGNNSAFTTNDLLLTPEQLDEYFAAFRERTEYLSIRFPEMADFVQYSEWSYMISMYNKIIKNNLTNCQKQLDLIKTELIKHYNEFYNGKYIEEFERIFMRKYINKGI